jgi:hypothetical protein
MRDMVTFPMIEEILEILDDHDINRELIEIPLGARDPGGIQKLGGGKIRVTVPESGDFEQWLEAIRPLVLAEFGVQE